MTEKKCVVVIGATSGIGKELARVYSQKGYRIGLTGRRRESLEALKTELGSSCFISDFDITQPGAEKKLSEFIDEVSNVDIIVINAGLGGENTELLLEHEEAIIQTNCLGFTKMAVASYNYFSRKGTGHIVGISSVLAIRGTWKEMAYSASKSYVTAYLNCLRNKRLQDRVQIKITDIKPGFVDTPMTKGINGMFWVAPPNKVALQIYKIVRAGKEHAYVTKRWSIIGILMSILPRIFFRRL